MAKTLPTSFPALDLNRLHVGEPVRAADYTTMVERMHHLWACHRGRSTGWNWDYLATSAGDLTNSIAGEPEIEDYQPILMASRPISGSEIRVGFRAFLYEARINANIYRLEPTPGIPVLIDSTAHVENADAKWKWLDNSVDIKLSDITVGGELVPIIFEFAVVAPVAFPPRIKRIQPFEAGVFDLAASNIP